MILQKRTPKSIHNSSVNYRKKNSLPIHSFKSINLLVLKDLYSGWQEFFTVSQNDIHAINCWYFFQRNLSPESIFQGILMIYMLKTFGKKSPGLPRLTNGSIFYDSISDSHSNSKYRDPLFSKRKAAVSLLIKALKL